MDPVTERQQTTGSSVSLLVVGVLLVAFNPVAGAIASGQWRPGNLWFWFQVASAVLIFVVGKIETRRARRLQASAEEAELEARVETRVALADLLDPMANLLGELAGADAVGRRSLCAEAIQVILSAAANYIGPDRSRASWFELLPGPPETLVPVRSLGRTGSAQTTFVAGTVAGDATLAMVHENRSLICRDIDTEAPPGWDAERDRDYRTFISVSVFTNGVPYGMLTLDALEVGELTEDDLLTMTLLAKLLAAALAERDRR
ncbi:GAF domain-containing protein [Friedmanniella endophytica]|uniref:GAF domain-containing protein n=1 Tax=Microlunatus kandeliicorticis TaxID=1759536 RepID=A0A7W3IV83_9ACTN|nr:GAF domain-containing protein [Microlunatus kandeliicorticis]MBA8795745.1 GAF domain-containing protein [Microlunatus kandeliicorticis]